MNPSRKESENWSAGRLLRQAPRARPPHSPDPPRRVGSKGRAWAARPLPPRRGDSRTARLPTKPPTPHFPCRPTPFTPVIPAPEPVEDAPRRESIPGGAAHPEPSRRVERGAAPALLICRAHLPPPPFAMSSQGSALQVRLSREESRTCPLTPFFAFLSSLLPVETGLVPPHPP